MVLLTIAADDSFLLQRLTMEAWCGVVKARQGERHHILSDAWVAWRSGILSSRHSRALQELETANAELHIARRSLLRQSRRFECLEAKLEKVDAMRTLLWCSWALSAWQWVCRSAKAEQAARGARARATWRLAGMLDARSRRGWAAACLRAWGARARQRLRTGALLEEALASLGLAELARAFGAWRGLACSGLRGRALERAAALDEELGRSRAELQGLRGIMSQLLAFAEDAHGHLRRSRGLEAALAVRLGPRRGRRRQAAAAAAGGGAEARREAAGRLIQGAWRSSLARSGREALSAQRSSLAAP